MDIGEDALSEVGQTRVWVCLCATRISVARARVVLGSLRCGEWRVEVQLLSNTVQIRLWRDREITYYCVQVLVLVA